MIYSSTVISSYNQRLILFETDTFTEKSTMQLQGMAEMELKKDQNDKIQSKQGKFVLNEFVKGKGYEEKLFLQSPPSSKLVSQTVHCT